MKLRYDAKPMSRSDFSNIGVIEKTKPVVKRPSFYVVVLHNDDFTPRGFVVEVLRKFFGKDETQAIRIMMLAHNHGIGVVAQFSLEIAESKVAQVNDHARNEGYPLHFSVEEQ